MEELQIINKQFAEDVEAGLTDNPKHLSSKYFYDEIGDKLFQDIMQLPEYYLTGCEYEILQTYKSQLAALFSEKGRFRLVELGAGDGYKTKVLIAHLLFCGVDFEYVPIDISENVLEQLSGTLKEEFPELQVNAIQGDYFEAIKQLSSDDRTKNVVLFLGSNIGNFTRKESISFLSALGKNLNKHDFLLVGFDLKKDPQKILDAYNDSQGVTRDFNLNLLDRINNELGGEFDLKKFTHQPTYNPATGEAKSYLVSTEKQRVTIAAIETNIEFEAWEAIHLEVSQKFTLKDVEELAHDAGFSKVENFFDKRNYFANSLWSLD